MRLKPFCLIIILVFVSQVMADEGIWLLNELPMETLNQAGFQLSADQMYDTDNPSWSDAIVQIGGGTGSFVSGNGLVVTNHHVAYDALQALSSEQHNYTRDGYEATSPEEELYAEGYQAFLALEWNDVTNQVLSNVTSQMSPAERANAIENAVNRIEEEASSDAGDIYRFEVTSFDSGLRYILFQYMRFDDIRLVYAPPEAIGLYGGDIDNWMWPRHTGDFAFFRFYISPDGESTQYSEDNVPFHPDKFLHFTDDGVSKGDFNFIVGYPGGTQRHRSLYSVRYNVNTVYPFRISYYTDALDIINAGVQDSEALRITYANTLSSLNNYLKNYKGMLDGIRRDSLIAQKEELQADFTEWVDQRRRRTRIYGEVLPGLDAVYTRLDSIELQDLLLGAMSRLVETYDIASTLDRWSLEKTKPSVERISTYADRNLPELKQDLRLIQREFTPVIDAQLMEYFLNRLIRLPAHLQIEPVREILSHYPEADTSEAVHQFVQSVYQNTELTDVDRRMEIFEMSRDEMRALDDPMLNFAMDLREDKDRIEQFNNWVDGRFTSLRPQWIRGLREWQGGTMYPDANFTPRLTYGEVKGYSPRDAVWYEHITSVDGVIEKYTGEAPFDAPDKLLNLIRQSQQPDEYVDEFINTVPVDFLNTTDITGGNSGSPVMDAQGRFIGIAFDGNWESISADWVFNPELTRAISTDARYILYILDEFAETHYVLDELKIE